MSKLHRAVDGQTIQFVSIPKIFNTLSADLPSGSITLPNGDRAYWRLIRNLTELRKNRKFAKETILRLAQTFKALVSSDAFLNHYGLTAAPEIPTEVQLVALFRSLLNLNTNRVEYTTITHGRQRPLVETIVVPLGNLTFFNAYRGVQNAPAVEGLKGKLWLTEGADADQCFHFNVVSPVVKLADFISGDRLANEIIGKIKQNLSLLAHNPKIVFADGQFEQYVGRGIEQLQAKHEHKTNQKPQKQQALTKPEQPSLVAGYDFALDVNKFNQLVDQEKAIYIENVSMVRNRKDQEIADTVIKGYLLSNILDREHSEYNAKTGAKYGVLSKPYYLAKIIGLIDEDVVALIGNKHKKFTAEPQVDTLVTTEEKLVIGEGTTMVVDATETPKPGFAYKTKEGDSLYSISEAAYGDGNGDLWASIHLPNRAVIEDPSVVPVGVVIRIPALDDISEEVSLEAGDEIEPANGTPA